MSDRTPADTWVPTEFDVWFHDHLVEDWGHDDVLAWDVAQDFGQRVATAGYRVVPIPDDNARAEVAELIGLLRGGWWDDTECEHVCDLLAAAYLDGQPQDRPDRCPTCDSDDRLFRNDVADPPGWPILCPDAWHVGGSGDTR